MSNITEIRSVIEERVGKHLANQIMFDLTDQGLVLEEPEQTPQESFNSITDVNTYKTVNDDIADYLKEKYNLRLTTIVANLNGEFEEIVIAIENKHKLSFRDKLINWLSRK